VECVILDAQLAERVWLLLRSAKGNEWTSYNKHEVPLIVTNQEASIFVTQHGVVVPYIENGGRTPKEENDGNTK
jgi:hypothetical protein